MEVKVAQSCLTLYNPVDYTVHGILHRILEWVPLLQQTFLTRESNQGLLHCRWILYELSHKRTMRRDYKQMNNQLSSSTIAPTVNYFLTF